MISSREALCLDIPAQGITSSFRILPLNCPCCLQACSSLSTRQAFSHEFDDNCHQHREAHDQQPPREACGSSGHSSMSSSQQSRTPLLLAADGAEESTWLDNDATDDNSRPSHMHHLLQDSEGVRLFKQFLEQQSEGSSALLDFWFACQGFKNNVGREENHKIAQLIKVIYRTYIRGSGAGTSRTARLCVSRETRHRISEKLALKAGAGGVTLDQSIFDEAQTEVEQLLRSSSYPAFIKSDIYLRYSAELATNSSATNTTKYAVGSDNLHTLDENWEFNSLSSASIPLFGGLNNNSNCATTPALTRHNLKMTRKERAGSPTGRRYHANKTSGVFYSANSASSPTAIPFTKINAEVGADLLPNPYHISYAPAVSVQDSELQSLSSDAHTDDTVSRTDSSVDGTVTCHAPHVKNKQRCQQRRAIRLSAQQNREVSTLPRADSSSSSGANISWQPPCVDSAGLLKQTNLAEQSPSEFTRILTDKLNLVVQDRTNIQKIDKLLIETDAMTRSSSSSSARDLTILRAPWAGRLLAAAQAAQTQDAQTILEDHCGRIWEKSGDGTPEARTRSPDAATLLANSGLRQNFKRTKAAPSSASVFSQDSGVVDSIGGHAEHCFVHHYHYHHHHTRSGKCDEDCAGDRFSAAARKFKQADASASDVSSNVDSGVGLLYDQIKSPSSSKVLAWMHNSQSSCSSSGAAVSAATGQLGLQGYVAAAALDTPLQAPRQPASSDPGMEPLGTPHTTVQLEEAKRRLQAMTQAVAAAAQARHLANYPNKRSPAAASEHVCSTSCAKTCATTTEDGNAVLTVGYYLCGDPVPYRSTWQGHSITLGQFKQLVAKKGCNYKFFFKRACNDFENGVVHEEITCEEEVLPLWEGKVFGKIERVE